MTLMGIFSLYGISIIDSIPVGQAICVRKKAELYSSSSPQYRTSSLLQVQLWSLETL